MESAQVFISTTLREKNTQSYQPNPQYSIFNLATIYHPNPLKNTLRPTEKQPDNTISHDAVPILLQIQGLRMRLQTGRVCLCRCPRQMPTYTRPHPNYRERGELPGAFEKVMPLSKGETTPPRTRRKPRLGDEIGFPRSSIDYMVCLYAYSFR